MTTRVYYNTIAQCHSPLMSDTDLDQLYRLKRRAGLVYNAIARCHSPLMSDTDLDQLDCLKRRAGRVALPCIHKLDLEKFSRLDYNMSWNFH